jgi:hypothetical protein
VSERTTELRLRLTDRTDASYIIRSRAAPGAPARKFKLNAEAGKRVLVRREPQPSLNAETEAEAEAKSKDKDEMEMRQVFQCTRCKTPGALNFSRYTDTQSRTRRQRRPRDPARSCTSSAVRSLSCKGVYPRTRLRGRRSCRARSSRSIIGRTASLLRSRSV